jgi:hypothetical protein
MNRELAVNSTYIRQFVGLSYRFVELSSALFDLRDIAIHIFLMDEPMTSSFPRFLGINQFEMESPEQRRNQLLHLH